MRGFSRRNGFYVGEYISDAGSSISAYPGYPGYPDSIFRRSLYVVAPVAHTLCETGMSAPLVAWMNPIGDVHDRKKQTTLELIDH